MGTFAKRAGGSRRSARDWDGTAGWNAQRLKNECKGYPVKVKLVYNPTYPGKRNWRGETLWR